MLSLLHQKIISSFIRIEIVQQVNKYLFSKMYMINLQPVFTYIWKLPNYFPRHHMFMKQSGKVLRTNIVLVKPKSYILTITYSEQPQRSNKNKFSLHNTEIHVKFLTWSHLKKNRKMWRTREWPIWDIMFLKRFETREVGRGREERAGKKLRAIYQKLSLIWRSSYKNYSQRSLFPASHKFNRLCIQWSDFSISI